MTDKSISMPKVEKNLLALIDILSQLFKMHVRYRNVNYPLPKGLPMLLQEIELLYERTKKQLMQEYNKLYSTPSTNPEKEQPNPPSSPQS